jgi:hypothetical protein
MLEDSKRYTDAVLFHNDNLMTVTGFTREHTMISVRNRAVQSGWLHYERGVKRRPGRYWVTIPERFAYIPDGTCDDADSFPDDSVSETGFPDDFVSESVGKASVKAEGKRQPFLPIPNPIPGRMHGRSDRRYATEFLTWYAAYPRKVAKGTAAKAYAKAAAVVGHEKLLNAAQAFAQSEVAHTEFCPYPATWLNSERYDDDPAEWNRHKPVKRCASKEELEAWVP